MFEDFINILGVIGSFLILLAFYKATAGKWGGQSWSYQLNNLAGAVLLVIYSYEKNAWAIVGLNFVWTLVALKGIHAIVKRRTAVPIAKP